MQVKLKSVFINATNKEGQPYTDKNGLPYHMAVITSESGNKASRRIWSNEPQVLQEILTWKSGDTVDITITPNGEYNNFDVSESVKNAKPLNESRVRELIQEGINKYLKEKKDIEDVTTMYSKPVGNNEPINVDEIPF